MDELSPDNEDAPPSPRAAVSASPEPVEDAQTQTSAESDPSHTSLSNPSQSVAEPASHPDTRHDERRHTSLATLKEKLRFSVSPSAHNLIERLPTLPPTARPYYHHRQRWRLWRLTIGEWFNTLALCLTYFGILYAYSQKSTMDARQRRIFNALSTGNSLLLGVNLAASLRSYAKLLRWRMLAVCYRPLETFDLVMGCDSLMNVITLLWKAKHSRHKFLPSRTQVFCVLWLLVNLAVTVLVGMIGLTYSLDVSTDFVLTITGNTSVVDLSSLLTDDYLSDLGAVQQWGIKGDSAQAIFSADLNPYDEGQGTYETLDDGYTRYYFQDVNPSNPDQSDVSWRYIESSANCSGYKVIHGQYGNLSYITYNDGDRDVNVTLGSPPGPGGLHVASNLNSTCGDRCTNIQAFQAETESNDQVADNSSPVILEGRYFLCTNTISTIEDLYNTPGAEYQISNVIARMLAGAMGWSETPPTAGTNSEYMTYNNSGPIGFSSTPDPDGMAQEISAFTMGAIAVMDDLTFGLPRMYIADGQRPGQAQVLHVTWRYAAAILAVIPFIHFWTLMAVIIWANKAIIKDGSLLSAAKVYYSLLKNLDGHGCMLRGDEIVTALGNPLVAYGWKSDQPGIGHTDVFDDASGMEVERAFREGWYDGTRLVRPTWRRGYRDIDAREYF